VRWRTGAVGDRRVEDRCSGAPTRWRPGGVLGSAPPVRWWLVAGCDAMVASRRAPPYVIFFFFFVCRVSQLGRTTKNIPRRLQAVSKGRRQLAFLCRAPPVAHDKDP
jgi:hypothetical protein